MDHVPRGALGDHVHVARLRGPRSCNLVSGPRSCSLATWTTLMEPGYMDHPHGAWLHGPPSWSLVTWTTLMEPGYMDHPHVAWLWGPSS